MSKSNGLSGLSVALWTVIGWTLASLMILIPALLLDAWVLTKLWGWFVVPTFTSAPPLHLAAAVGISLLVGFVTRTYNFDYKPESEKKKDFAGRLSFTFLSPIVIVLLGWIIQAWV